MVLMELEYRCEDVPILLMHYIALLVVIFEFILEWDDGATRTLKIIYASSLSVFHILVNNRCIILLNRI
jgi:hypothetical protein